MWLATLKQRYWRNAPHSIVWLHLRMCLFIRKRLALSFVEQCQLFKRLVINKLYTLEDVDYIRSELLHEKWLKQP